LFELAEEEEEEEDDTDLEDEVTLSPPSTLWGRMIVDVVVVVIP